LASLLPSWSPAITAWVEHNETDCNKKQNDWRPVAGQKIMVQCINQWHDWDHQSQC